MFTGIIEEMGVVKAVERTLAGARLSVLASTVMDDLGIGDSVSVNGACLTVVSRDEREFTVDVSTETLSATSLGPVLAGAPVNLERAMKIHQRIGGHQVDRSEFDRDRPALLDLAGVPPVVDLLVRRRGLDWIVPGVGAIA